MKRLFCLLFLLLCSTVLLAGQDRHEIDTAYFHDTQRTHTLESILAQEFIPYQGQLRLGFVEGETWIRIKLKDPLATLGAETTSALVLRVEPYSLDRLSFYQLNAGNWTPQHGGVLQLPKKNICIDLQHCFSFSPVNVDAVYAYLKVETTGARIVRTDVMMAEDMLKSSIATLKSINTALNLSIALLILSVAFFFLNAQGCFSLFVAFR